MRLPHPEHGKHTGLTLELAGGKRVTLTEQLARNQEISLYYTDEPDVLVKFFDLDCGKADEIGYGPYLGFSSELANYRDLLEVGDLRYLVPGYHGAEIDYERKHAYIAMERLRGEDLQAWCTSAGGHGHAAEGGDPFRRAVHDVLWLMALFHRHGYVLIDFKPDNAMRLADETIRLVDLGALFTPRHRRDLASYAYSATPDHAEVLIDVSNLQAGVAPTEASDVFAAGVALFEMATGLSRLAIDPQTAEELLATPRVHRFRDSQIRDVWRAFPHLKDVLPLIQTQLEERRILFADLWPLLKAYLAEKVSDWESLPAAHQEQVLLTAGTTFIQEQLPPRVSYLAGPIARATTLRSLRLATVAELIGQLSCPAPDHAREDLDGHNGFLAQMNNLEGVPDLRPHLNSWDVRQDPQTGRWAVAAPCAWRYLGDAAPFVFLSLAHRDGAGHAYWRVVDELGADAEGGSPATLSQIGQDHRAWLV